MPKRIWGSAVVTMVVGLGLGASLAFAGPIEERQTLMKENGKAIGALAAIAKKQTPFDAAVVKKNAGIIAHNLEAVEGLFPEGSQKGEKETYAKAEIWTDRAGFEQIRMKARDAAAALAAVTEQSAFGAALGAVGNGCKNCHEKYRRPKE